MYIFFHKIASDYSNKFYNYSIDVVKKNRKQNKEIVINLIIEKLLEILGD